MSHLKTKSSGIMILGIILLVLMNTNVFPCWISNTTGDGFVDGGDAESRTASAIEDYIVDGAGYFLDSYDKVLVFMKKTELMDKQSVSNEELASLLDTALAQMQLANDTYVNLKMTADNTPYNTVVIDALKNFNYDAFKEKNGLNGDVFKVAAKYLSKGDIRGVYGKTLEDTGKIIDLLNQVKNKIDAGVVPPLNEVWKLNQAYSQSLLFGQYVTQVFYNL